MSEKVKRGDEKVSFFIPANIIYFNRRLVSQLKVISGVI